MTQEQPPEDAYERTHLADLVRDRKEALGFGYERLAARAIDPVSEEQTIKSSWLHRLVSGQKVIAPQVEQLRGLAVALEIPLARVQDAAGAQFFGIDAVWSSSGEARALVEHANRMTPEQRERLIALVESIAVD